jgi:hypothetical protein
VVWTLLLLLGGLLATRSLSGALSSHAEFTNWPESRQAQALLEQRLTGPRRSAEAVIVQSTSQTVDARRSGATCSSSSATSAPSGPA